MKISELLNEQIISELKMLDSAQYGGWISPARKVFYCDEMSHLELMRDLLKKENIQVPDMAVYDKAKKLGWVRFVTDEMPDIFSVDGHPNALKKTYSAWAPTALSSDYVLIYQNDDSAEDAFFMPKDKGKLIKKYGPSAVKEAMLTELKMLEDGHYGAWISPKRQVFYVEEYGHEAFISKYFQQLPDDIKSELMQVGYYNPTDSGYTNAFRMGYVRLVLNEMPRTFSIEGHPGALKKTYSAWAPTALTAHFIQVYDKKRDHNFAMPHDKAKFIQFVQSIVPPPDPAPGQSITDLERKQTDAILKQYEPND